MFVLILNEITVFFVIIVFYFIDKIYILYILYLWLVFRCRFVDAFIFIYFSEELLSFAI